METLFLRKNKNRDFYSLVDGRGILVGFFDSQEEAEEWCKENHYQIKIEESSLTSETGKIHWPSNK